jgi:hypothetical protein
LGLGLGVGWGSRFGDVAHTSHISRGRRSSIPPKSEGTWLGLALGVGLGLGLGVGLGLGLEA